MRLTLRTLLAYLDDTLDAAQIKQIGQKVAESDTAQELIARIKQVTRRRRLTTPPATGPGARLDANTLAEYLENKLSEDQVAEVEQICLGSDVHLAELAACHQLQTLILGEPMLIPPTSKQRMYALVKSREAIPFRKPTDESRGKEEKEAEESYETDETLRLGLPPWHKRNSWASRMTLIGGCLAACLLLVIAIYQALQPPGEEPHKKDTTQAKGNGTGKTPPTTAKPTTPEKTTGQETAGNGGTKKTETEKTTTTPEKTPTSKEQTGKTPTDTKKTVKTTTEPKKTKTENGKTTTEPGPKTSPFKVVPIKAPSTVVREAGDYKLNASGEPGMLLQQHKDAGWKRVEFLNPKVFTGTPLVSLPGYQSIIHLKGDGLHLKLLGNLPEETAQASLAREATIEIHHHEELDLDMTLHRGKLILTNTKDKPAHIRLRVKNPTDLDNNEVWDLLLEEKGTEVFMERNTQIAPGEPFYPDPKQTGRKGPIAAVHIVVREGKVSLRREQETFQLQKPPGDARFYWVSSTGRGKQKLDEYPDYASDKTDIPQPKFEKDVKADVKKQILDLHQKFLETRAKMKGARKKLSMELTGKSGGINVVLTTMEKSENMLDRILAVRCYGALDRVDALVDSLGNTQFIDVRRTAIDTLRRWLSYERDNDYKLFEELNSQQVYTKNDSINIITMLHGFSLQDALTSSAVYDAIIPKLNHSKIALRELAGLQLYFELQKYFPEPLGLDIKYAPEAPEQVRAQAVTQWQALVNQGKLPPPKPKSN